MSDVGRWEAKRKDRQQGRITAAQWIAWAEEYVKSLPDGPWKEHCRTHIRFVRRTS
jgi:hypothetical protein